MTETTAFRSSVQRRLPRRPLAGHRSMRHQPSDIDWVRNNLGAASIWHLLAAAIVTIFPFPNSVAVVEAMTTRNTTNTGEGAPQATGTSLAQFLAAIAFETRRLATACANQVSALFRNFRRVNCTA